MEDTISRPTLIDEDEPSRTVEVTSPPTLAEGAELMGEFEGSGYREAPQLVCRADGQMVHLPPVLYLIVQVMDGQRDAAAPLDRDQVLAQVAEVVSQQTGRTFGADHISYLLDKKLAPLGVTTYSDGSAPATEKANPRLSLRFRLGVVPESVTWVLGGLFAWLYRPAAMALAVPAAIAAEIWAFGVEDMGAALQEVLLVPAGVLMVVFLTVFSTAFHEIGHAAACRYGGAAPGRMGCGIYLVWPVFYTDVTNSYRLGRRGRLRTDLGGVYFNALFVIGLVGLYLQTGLEPFLVAILATNLEMIRQLLPTLRFDGYYIVSDLVGLPDLFKYIGPILKRTFLRYPPDPQLKALKQWPQRIVSGWVLIVLPVLVVQLGFIAFQVPYLLQTALNRVQALVDNVTGASGSYPDPIALTTDAFHAFMLMLPVAGLIMITVIWIRAVIRITRRRAQQPGPRHLAHRNRRSDMFHDIPSGKQLGPARHRA